jgi:phage/conjugal plasmid C-4 type zinc finger TraR family protein
MNSSDAAFDQAEELAKGERQSGIKTASKALSRRGTAECIGCGNPIGERRRKILPSATRCVECQTAYEKEQAW